MVKKCPICGKEITCKKLKKYCSIECKNKSQEVISSNAPYKEIIRRKWENMKTRCYNKNNYFYRNYGGRGIRICNEWKNSFASFYYWCIASGFDGTSTIDRINVDGNYEPGNCRWLNSKQQCNNKTNNQLITYREETHTLTEWAEIRGMRVSTLWYRFRLNWPVEDMLFKPVKNFHNNRKITYQGKSLSGYDWDRLQNFRLGTVSGRLAAGWSVEDAINKPIAVQFRSKS